MWILYVSYAVFLSVAGYMITYLAGYHLEKLQKGKKFNRKEFARSHRVTYWSALVCVSMLVGAVWVFTQ